MSSSSSSLISGLWATKSCMRLNSSSTAYIKRRNIIRLTEKKPQISVIVYNKVNTLKRQLMSIPKVFILYCHFLKKMHSCFTCSQAFTFFYISFSSSATWTMFKAEGKMDQTNTNKHSESSFKWTSSEKISIAPEDPLNMKTC